MIIVLYETEAARSFLETIEAHHETFDLAALGEQFMDLFFSGVERQVTNVEGGRILQFIFDFRLELVFAIAAISLAFTLLKALLVVKVVDRVNFTNLLRNVRARLVKAVNSTGNVRRHHREGIEFEWTETRCE
jgi:hypothetical protein